MSRDLEPVTIRIREVPPSLNQLGSGNRMKFWRIKKEWQARFLGALTAAELPHGLARVIVEGQIMWRGRDLVPLNADGMRKIRSKEIGVRTALVRTGHGLGTERDGQCAPDLVVDTLAQLAAHEVLR